MNNEMKLVYTFNKMYLALIAKQILEENNIESHILNKKDSSYVVIGDIELYVNEIDEIKAKVLLKDIEN